MKKIKNFLAYLYQFLTGQIRQLDTSNSIHYIAEGLLSNIPFNTYPYRCIFSDGYRRDDINYGGVYRALLHSGFEEISRVGYYEIRKEGSQSSGGAVILAKEDILIKLGYSPCTQVKWQEYIPFKQDIHPEELLNLQHYLKTLNTSSYNVAYEEFCIEAGYSVCNGIRLYLKHNPKYGNGDVRDSATIYTLLNLLEDNILTPMNESDLKWLEDETIKTKEMIEAITNVPKAE